MYEEARQPGIVQVTGGHITHHDGYPWYEHPTPPLRHTCEPASSGTFDYGNRKIDRCTCGAYREWYMGWDDYGPWKEKNSIRRGTHGAHNLTIH